MTESSLEEVELAIARSSHELHGINIVNSANCSIHSPLMCSVEYKGFRVICQADMEYNNHGPVLIQELTSQVPKFNERANELLGIVGRFMNLKPHAVMLKDDRRVNIPTAAGVEVSLLITAGFS